MFCHPCFSRPPALKFVLLQHMWAILWPSCGHLGSMLASFWPRLDPSWVIWGPTPSHCGLISEPLWASRPSHMGLSRAISRHVLPLFGARFLFCRRRLTSMPRASAGGREALGIVAMGVAPICLPEAPCPKKAGLPYKRAAAKPKA